MIFNLTTRTGISSKIYIYNNERLKRERGNPNYFYDIRILRLKIIGKNVIAMIRYLYESISNCRARAEKKEKAYRKQ